MAIECTFCKTSCADQSALQVHQAVECPAVDAMESEIYVRKEENEMKELAKHFEAMKVGELKQELKSRGLLTSGDKKSLKLRLLDAEGLSDVIIDTVVQEEGNIAQYPISNQEAAKKFEAEEHGDDQLPIINEEAERNEADDTKCDSSGTIDVDASDKAKVNIVDEFQEFKDYISDELFILKESMQQKLEARALEQQLENLNPRPNMEEKRQLELLVNKLQQENLMLQNENQSFKSQNDEMKKQCYELQTLLYSKELELNQMKLEQKAAQSKVKLVEYEIEFLNRVNVSNTKMITDLLYQRNLQIGSHNKVVMQSPSKEPTPDKLPDTWIYPKRTAPQNTAIGINDFNLKTTNRYGSLRYHCNGNEIERKPEQNEGKEDMDPDMDTARIDNKVPPQISQQNKTSRKASPQKLLSNHDNQKPGQKQFAKTVPGNTSYAARTRSGKNIMVAGDSIISGMSGKHLSGNLKHGHGFIKPFLGATAEEMRQFYLQPLMQRGGVDAAVLMVGTNNLGKKPVAQEDGSEKLVEQTPDEIVTEILKTGDECRKHNINNVFINSIIHRRNKTFSDKIDEINYKLEQKCTEHNFIFINNENLNEGYHGDNVHLTYDGKRILSSNFAKSINYFYDA